MTLEGAIKHLEETLADPGHDWGCEECKAEHEQLLEWLKGYRVLLREVRDIAKENIKLRDALETACTALEKVHKCGGISCEVCNAAVGFCPHDDSWYLPFMSETEKIINGEGVKNNA